MSSRSASGRWSATFRRLCTVQRWISAAEPNTFLTAVANAFAPSRTNSTPPVVSRPRSTRSASNEVTTVAFSVSPSYSPTGTLVPSVVMASATTIR